MSTFTNFAIRHEYASLAALGDRLGEIQGLIDWAAFRPLLDRISFRHFLGYPETIPDRSTIWLFRERLAQTGKDTAIWEEFQRQLETQGLMIKRGVILDATSIAADSGHAAAATPRGDQARTRRSRDGTWAKKGVKVAVWVQTPYLHGQRLPAHPPDRDDHSIDA